MVNDGLTGSLIVITILLKHQLGRLRVQRNDFPWSFVSPNVSRFETVYAGKVGSVADTGFGNHAHLLILIKMLKYQNLILYA